MTTDFYEQRQGSNIALLLYTGVTYYIQVLGRCNVIYIEVLAYEREEYTGVLI